MDSFLDYQAVKPVDKRVLKAMNPFLFERFGNPSSLHTKGNETANVLGRSRQIIASFIGAEPEEIIFTSGATESNNLALIGYAQRNRANGDHIVISEIEHISIQNLAKQLLKMGFKISKVPVDHYGEINIEKLKDQITKNTLLVSIQYASNEIGTIQPVQEIGSLCKEREVAFHTDAVAAEGLVPLDVDRDNVDLMSLSSNDIYGPPGLGALYIRKGIRLKPVIIGGGQERGLRSGTENIPAIVGMAKAANIAKNEMAQETERLFEYRDSLIKTILEKVPKSYLNGHPEKRLANNINIRFDGIEGESLLLLLNNSGISASSGSACTSKTLEPSQTLMALGLMHEQAHGSLELTTGRFTKPEDIDAVISSLPEAVTRLRKMSPLYSFADE